jgi:hypothetical protein
MNKKYVGLVVLLVLHGSVHSMQYAGRFALNGARVGSELYLLEVVSEPLYSQGLFLKPA